MFRSLNSEPRLKDSLIIKAWKCMLRQFLRAAKYLFVLWSQKRRQAFHEILNSFAFCNLLRNISQFLLLYRFVCVSCFHILEILNCDSLSQFSVSIIQFNQLCIYWISESYLVPLRSSHLRCSIQKAVLKNFAIFTKNMCQSLFFNKVGGLLACNLGKKRLQRRVLSCEYCENTY